MTKDDSYIRRAIWAAHNKRCPYCRQPIRWGELECEHVIPKCLEEDRVRLETILKHFNLPSDYSLDSLDNLLPAHTRCNQQKSNHADIGYLTHFRYLAMGKIGKVQRFLARYSREDALDENLASISQSVLSGVLDPEDVYDSLTRTANPFANVTNMETNPIQLSRSRVLLHCRVPALSEPEGHLAVTFRHVELRAMQLNIAHEDIVRILYRSLGGPPSPRLRSFVSHWDDQAQKYLVELVGASFPLNEEEMKQFCECIDLLAPIYLGAFRQVEEAISGTDFELLRAGDYRLQRIPRTLWALMLEFAKQHDLAKGKSKWHVFDWNSAALRLIWRTEKEWGYQGMVYAEREGEPDCLHQPDDKVWLCWSLADYRMLRRDEPHPKVWNVSEAATFLSQLIPIVLEWAEKTGVETKEISKALKEEQRWVDAPGDVRFGSRLLSKIDFQTAKSSVRWFQKMQMHYSNICHDFVPHGAVDAIVRFILAVMEELPCPGHGIDYFLGNLEGVWKHGTGDPKARAEQRRLELLNETALAGHEADHCLRALCWWLDESKEGRLSSFSFEKHYRLFEPLVTHFNQSRYLMRLQCWPHELR